MESEYDGQLITTEGPLRRKPSGPIWSGALEAALPRAPQAGATAPYDTALAVIRGPAPSPPRLCAIASAHVWRSCP
jgi:hypothetical protein